MAQGHALDGLIRALQRLPGVGVKSASRMAYYLLQHDRDSAVALAQALQAAAAAVHHCRWCHTLTEDDLCATCSDQRRDPGLLCVVETPADMAAMERTGAYSGLYFVLMGKISPLDGLGPRQIGLQQLFDRLWSGEPAPVRELILATSFTGEGEATAHVITQALKGQSVQVTRLARGVPIGSELEYVDLGTIAHALSDRR